jgi:hypothetical protein
VRGGACRQQQQKLVLLSRTRHTQNLFFLCADDYDFESSLQELEIPPVRVCRMRVRERADVQQPPQLGSTPSTAPAWATAGWPDRVRGAGQSPPRCRDITATNFGWRSKCDTSSRRHKCAEVEMLPNYRGLLAVIPPPVVPQGSHQPVSDPKICYSCSRAAILAGPLPVACASFESCSFRLN